MTEPSYRAVMSRLYADLAELDRVLSQHPQPPQPYAPPVMPYWPPPPPPAKPRQQTRPEGWIGKVLAVAGVSVTLIGVVLLLVLAAQAGLLRPEIRVMGGGVLAVGLVASAWWLVARPGGRVGAIALAATGIGAAYIDVIAVTTIYHWVAAPVGLVISAVIGGGGMALARRWNSQHLALLVLVPLIGLAPIITDGITLLLVGFMLALSAASLPVQLGRDWIWLHAARTAAATLPLLIALAGAYFGAGRDLWLAGACGIAAALAVGGALMLVPRSRHRAATALLTAAGVAPVLCVASAVDKVLAALMAATLAAAMLAIVLAKLPGVTGVVRHIWSGLSAGCALIAVIVAFDGYIGAPVLLAMAVVVAIAGRRDEAARWIAIGLGIVGGATFLGYASPGSLVVATEIDTATGISTLISSVLLTACALVVALSWRTETVVWAGCAATIIYAVTAFTVTAGVLIGGVDGGFLAGHMAATICWIAMAAALFGYAARVAKPKRSLPIGAGLALVGAATGKLFLFDLGTLDGIFRVAVFIVVGLVLLGMGAGYARLLEKQDLANLE